MSTETPSSSPIVKVVLSSGEIRPMPVEQAVEVLADQTFRQPPAMLCDVNPWQAHDIHRAVVDLRVEREHRRIDALRDDARRRMHEANVHSDQFQESSDAP